MGLKAAPGCCEEASVASHDTYIPCNRPARYMVGFRHSSAGPYRMCTSCAEHNVSNRGAEILEAIRPAAGEVLEGEALEHFNDHFGYGQGGAE